MNSLVALDVLVLESCGYVCVCIRVCGIFEAKASKESCTIGINHRRLVQRCLQRSVPHCHQHLVCHWFQP